MSMIEISEFSSMAHDLDEEIGEVYVALGYFLNAEFARADEAIRSKCEMGYPYHNLGKSFLLFIKSLFTFDPEDIASTLEQLEHTIDLARKIVDSQRPSVYERLSYYVRYRPQETTKVSEDLERLKAHCELIVAELALLRAVLLISTDDREGWMLMVRQSLHVRSSYNFYTKSLSSPHMDDPNFRSAILLGNGIFNLLFPLLPPKVIQTFAFFGYRGDTALGLKQLRESSNLAKCIRSPLSSLVILIYHLVIAFLLPTAEILEDNKAECDAEWYVMCNSILDESLKKYPESPIYKYFLGRFLFIQRRLREAVVVFEEAMKMEIEWPQLKHAGYWEVCLCSLYTLDWERGYKYSRVMSKENKWSKAFYQYLEAIFLWSMDESRFDEVKSLLSEIPGMMKRVAGRSIPIEKFALHRANMVLEQNRMPFHPALEIALLWDGLPWVSQKDRDYIEAMMIKAIPDIEDHEKKCQILLTLASLKRLQKNYGAAIEYSASALRLKVPDDSYCIPLGNIELSQAHLEQGNLKMAEKYYMESVNYKHQYLVKKFLEIRQSRLRIEIELAKSTH